MTKKTTSNDNTESAPEPGKSSDSLCAILPDGWSGSLVSTNFPRLRLDGLDPDGDPLMATASGEDWRVEICFAPGRLSHQFCPWLTATHWDGRNWNVIYDDSEISECHSTFQAALTDMLAALGWLAEKAPENAEDVLEPCSDDPPSDAQRALVVAWKEIGGTCAAASAHLRKWIESGERK
jgi:hypothetical protein